MLWYFNMISYYLLARCRTVLSTSLNSQFWKYVRFFTKSLFVLIATKSLCYSGVKRGSSESPLLITFSFSKTLLSDTCLSGVWSSLADDIQFAQNDTFRYVHIKRLIIPGYHPGRDTGRESPDKHKSFACLLQVTFCYNLLFVTIYLWICLSLQLL